MRASRTRTTLVLTVSLLTGLAVVTQGTASPVQSAASHSTTAVADDSQDISGGGWLERAACVACASGLLIAGGFGSIVGMVGVMVLYPNFVAGCVLGCIEAYS